jgi:hypothetical protein
MGTPELDGHTPDGMNKLEVSGKKNCGVCLSVIRRSSETRTSREKLLQLKKIANHHNPKSKRRRG